MELLVYPTLVLSVGKDYPELGYGNKPPRLKHWISFTAQAIQNILGVGGRVFFKLVIKEPASTLDSKPYRRATRYKRHRIPTA